MDEYIAGTPIVATTLLQRVDYLERTLNHLRQQLDQRDAEVDARLEAHRQVLGLEYNAKTTPELHSATSYAGPPAPHVVSRY